MDFYQVLASRRSVRAFLDRPVEKEKLTNILKAAMSAPSAGNLQSYQVVASAILLCFTLALSLTRGTA